MGSVLCFSVGGIRCALPLEMTMFLVRMVKPVPATSDHPAMIGLLRIHGNEIPIFSVRRLLGVHDRDPRISDHLIITRDGQKEAALWVDETFVVQDGDVPDSCRNPENSPSSVPGITVRPDGLVCIHDLTRFIEFSRNGGDGASVLLRDLIPLSGKEDGETDSGSGNDPAILLQRADELARPVPKPREVSSIEVLTFQLVYREYAVELKFVRESVLSREITPVPGTPEHVIGVLPVRGEIIPLIDLRVLLRIPDTGLTDLNQVIVLTDGGITFGILADQITGISTIPRDQVVSPEPGRVEGKPGYILGMGTDDLIVINAAAILSDSAMIVDDSVEPGTFSSHEVRDR